MSSWRKEPGLLLVIHASSVCDSVPLRPWHPIPLHPPFSFSLSERSAGASGGGREGAHPAWIICSCSSSACSSQKEAEAPCYSQGWDVSRVEHPPSPPPTSPPAPDSADTMRRDCMEASFWLGAPFSGLLQARKQLRKGRPLGTHLCGPGPGRVYASSENPPTPSPPVPRVGALLAPQDFLPVHSKAKTHQAASAKRDLSRQQGIRPAGDR